jgi:hypothetical protein
MRAFAMSTLLLLTAVAFGRGASQSDRLDFFVGSWNQSNRFFASELGPAGSGIGISEYRWGLGHKWLMFDSRFEAPGIGTYQAHGLIAQTDGAGHYRAFVFNSLGSVVEYDGIWADDSRLVFTATSGTNAGRARVVYQKRADGSVRFTAEKLTSDGRFEPYFESILVRQP